MESIAMYVWMATILGGLLLFSIWIMEYDREYQSSAATRLPVPVISTHALLGMGGLILWVSYQLVDQQRLAWGALIVLGAVALLGLIMAARWIGVLRSYANPGASLSGTVTVPPERKFPVPLVIIHGVLAVVTVGLVLYSALGGGGS